MVEMGLMMFGMIFFWVALILAAVWFVGLLFQNGTSRSIPSQDQMTPAQVLDLCYSRGEINREQYQQIIKDMQT